MQRTIKTTALVAAALLVGTAGAFAQGHIRHGDRYRDYRDSMAWVPPGPPADGPGYVAGPPGPYYYRAPGWGRRYGGANHPTPSSTQGDVGPEGNNNGTLTGYYRGW
jgi:hypothetical protein